MPKSGLLTVVYDDDYFVVAFKPAGMLVHRTSLAAEKDPESFMLQQLRDQMQQPLFPVHRLDRATSGVVLFAKSSRFAAQLSRLFAEQKIDKSYFACVRGWVNSKILEESDSENCKPFCWQAVSAGDCGIDISFSKLNDADWSTVDYPLDKPKSHLTEREIRQRRKVAEKGEDTAALKKPASTNYRPTAYLRMDYAVDRYPEAHYSIIELKPLTGRPHQLRRHMKAIAHPIVGDVKYGKGVHNRFFRDYLKLDQLLLLAHAVRFEHPVTEEKLAIYSGAECDFSRYLLQWGLIQVEPVMGN